MACRRLVRCARLTECQLRYYVLAAEAERMYLILDTSHPLAMAALQTADPGRYLFSSGKVTLDLPKKPLPPTTSSLGTAVFAAIILSY